MASASAGRRPTHRPTTPVYNDVISDDDILRSEGEEVTPAAVTVITTPRKRRRFVKGRVKTAERETQIRTAEKERETEKNEPERKEEQKKKKKKKRSLVKETLLSDLSEDDDSAAVDQPELQQIETGM
jgi:hypothetical protein